MIRFLVLMVWRLFMGLLGLVREVILFTWLLRWLESRRQRKIKAARFDWAKWEKEQEAGDRIESVEIEGGGVPGRYLISFDAKEVGISHDQVQDVCNTLLKIFQNMRENEVMVSPIPITVTRIDDGDVEFEIEHEGEEELCSVVGIFDSVEGEDGRHVVEVDVDSGVGWSGTSSSTSYERIARPKIEYISMQISRADSRRKYGSDANFTAQAFINAVLGVIVQFKKMTIESRVSGQRIPKYMADLRIRDLVIQIHPCWAQVCHEGMYEQFAKQAFMHDDDKPEIRMNNSMSADTIIFNLTESYLLKCGMFTGSEFEGLKG